jgi:hypothetical protein
VDSSVIRVGVDGQGFLLLCLICGVNSSCRRCVAARNDVYTWERVMEAWCGEGPCIRKHA